MLGLLMEIIALIAAGTLVAYAIILTFRWLRNKIKEKIAAWNVKKVAVADLGELVNTCHNTCSYKDLEDMHNDGYTHLIATVDKDGKVDDVEIIRNTSTTIDDEVDRFINRTGEGMVVISK